MSVKWYFLFKKDYQNASKLQISSVHIICLHFVWCHLNEILSGYLILDSHLVLGVPVKLNSNSFVLVFCFMENTMQEKNIYFICKCFLQFFNEIPIAGIHTLLNSLIMSIKQGLNSRLSD